MPMLCLVCHSEDRVKIDRSLKQRIAIDTLSRKYDISPSSLKRHRKAHVLGLTAQPSFAGGAAEDNSAEALFKKWSDRTKLDSPESVLQFARFQVYRLERIVDRSEESGDLKTAVSAINASLKATTDLFAKYTGLISDAPRIDQSTKIVALLGSYSEEELRGFLEGRALAPIALPKGEKQ